MDTETVKTCPKCHAPIPSEAPQGLCPQCLLAAASAPTEAGACREPTAAPSLESIAAGFPHLEILEFIGQGGMGLVFKARQPKLDRFVALKLLPQKPGADPAFCERFNREARVLAKLSHPNIVAVHDFGEAGPFFYLLMEFVDGVNLRQAMQAGRFTSAQALTLVPKICDALQYAHDEGVLHRDIKPENLLLDTRGRIKIADFGIAKLLGEAKDITLTARGAAIGTPHYMAPEQLERPQDVDQRADVYSLGVVFYEMLTGELPIGRFAPPSEKATIDPRLDQVVLRSLEKERERRFQSAGDVKTEVEQIKASPGGAETKPSQRGTEAAHPAGIPPVVPTSFASWMTLVASAGLVGASLFTGAVTVFIAARGGNVESLMLPWVVGLSALAGTLSSWRTLHNCKVLPGRGERLVLFTAVAWPLLLLSVVVFLLFSVPIGVFELIHVPGQGLLRIVGVIAILVVDVWLIGHWLDRWKSHRELPDADLRAFLRKRSRPAVWIAGLALMIFTVLILAGFGQIHRGGLVQPAPLLQVPNAPTGFEVAPGGPPYSDEREYRSGVVVPPGYALTISTVLCSNQIVLRQIPPNATAVLMAPEGQPVRGLLTWRLLGNATFADGAPLQLSLNGSDVSNHRDKVFHVAPPEPITVDWVGEPLQVWPPQNGHTKFLLLKGTSATPNPESGLPTEWAAGLETRLDPIPAELLGKLKSPAVELGTNWMVEDIATPVNP